MKDLIIAPLHIPLIPEPIKNQEFNPLPDMGDSPIIPLPAPYVRTRTETEPTIPDENVSES